MTSPQPLPPHQDPTPQSMDGGPQVSMMEFTTTLIAQLDRRFDTLHEDLKQSIADRMAASDIRYEQRFHEANLRYEQRFIAQEAAVQAALAAQDKAVSKGEMANEKRFDSVNEFRKTLADQASQFMPRAEALSSFANISEKIELLRAQSANEQGRAMAVPTTSDQIRQLTQEVQALRDYRAANTGKDEGSDVINTLKSIQNQIDNNSRQIITSQGSDQGKQQQWGVIVGAIGVVGVIISILVVFMNLLAG